MTGGHAQSWLEGPRLPAQSRHALAMAASKPQGLVGSMLAATMDRARQLPRTPVERFAVRPLSNLVDQSEGGKCAGVATSAGCDSDPSAGALLQGLAREAVVDTVVQHDEADIRAHGPLPDS